MKAISILFLLSIVTSFYACTKSESIDVELPSTVDIGNSQLYLNGTLTDFTHQFFHDTVNNQMIFAFERSDISKNSKNSLGFTFLPYNEGKFILHRERILYKGAFTSFGQVIAEDLDGWEFELDKPEDGYFEIIKLDKSNKNVLIKFKAKFKLVSKNGNGDTGLPENVKFEGIFHETYQEG